MDATDEAPRQRILLAALKRFSESGYAGTSVQEIVDDAGVTKPTLYYYFKSKAGLFQALIDWAHDERFRLMQEAAGRKREIAGQLTEILTVLFEFLSSHRELMRIAFATAFAAKGEIPPEIRYLDKCRRNMEFIHGLIRQGIAAGALKRNLDSEQLVMGIFGMMNIHVMAYLVNPRRRLSRETARSIVQLYLEGAGRPKARTA